MTQEPQNENPIIFGNCLDCLQIATERDISVCRGCASSNAHHTSNNIPGSISATHYFVVLETPFTKILGPTSNIEKHNPWNDSIEQKLLEIFHRIKSVKYSQYVGHYTYAVKCYVEKPKRATYSQCAKLLQKELKEYAITTGPAVLLAMGPGVVKSLGIKYQKYAKIRGKLFIVKDGNTSLYVLPTFSKAELLANPGVFDVFEQHINTLLHTVHRLNRGDKVDTAPNIGELTQKYIYPKTLKELVKLVDKILDYSEPGGDPANHPIALDTETNTLYPHKDKLKLLSLVCAWDTGLAASIPIEHSESPWTLEEIRPHITRLLQSQKPKVFHNAKFDLKVLRKKGFVVNHVSWDTMLGEHLLSENKRGNYSLKSITTAYLPEYAGYEEELGEVDPDNDNGFADVPLEKLNVYGAIDADVTLQISILQRKRAEQENQGIAERRLFELKRDPNNPWTRKLTNRGCKEDDVVRNLMVTRAIPMTHTLSDMEFRGIRVDRHYAKELIISLDALIITLSMQLAQMVPGKMPGGVAFNPNSSPHIQRILFGHGYIHPETENVISYKGVISDEELSKTDTGQIQVDAKFLKYLQNKYSCIFSRVLLEYRALVKARNTFLKNIYDLSAEDGYMHTSFHINGTATGRLSSSDENMQNIPKKIREHSIKKLFIPSNPDTQVIVNADAKAAEVRLYAAYSKDANLIDALRKGMDPHSYFGSVVYNPDSVLTGVPASQRDYILNAIGIDLEHAWTYDDFQNRGNLEDKDYGKRLGALRDVVKRVVFGILYGAGRNKISDIVGISPEQASAIIDTLFKMFPTIPLYIDLVKSQVRKIHVVETFFGRRRRFPVANMTRSQLAKADRQAVNFKIQSTSSDIVMGVMCAVQPEIESLGGRLLITVHDSIVMECPKDNVHKIPDIIRNYGVEEVAKQYPWLPVPFQWDVEVGPSYGELTPIEKYLTQEEALSDEKDDDDDLEIIQALSE